MSTTFSRSFYGMFFTLSQSGGNDPPMVDYVANGTGNFISDLSTLKARSARGIIRFVGSASNYRLSDLSFSLASWKAKMDEAFAKAPVAQVRNFVLDGTLLANHMMDDCKPGSVVYGGKPPTIEDLEAMAQYSKSTWSFLPCTVRVDNIYLATKGSTYSYVDFGWNQWHKRFGDAHTWFVNNINAGREVGLGALLGFNLLDGGSGLTAPWNISPNISTSFGISPMELDAITQSFSQLSYAIGVAGWSAIPSQDDTDYYSYTGIPDALQRMAAVAVGRAMGPINWRDQSPSGSTDTTSGSTTTVGGAWSIRDNGSATVARGNNVATLNVQPPSVYAENDLHCLVVYSRDTGRQVADPSGWSSTNSIVGGAAAQGGELKMYHKLGSAAAEQAVALTFTGSGSAGQSQMARWFVVSNNSTVLSSIVNVAGSVASWASQTGMGPIPGLTSTVSDAIVMIVGARANDFGGGSIDENAMSETTSTAGETWNRLFMTGNSAGNDSGFFVDWAASSGTVSIGTKSWSQTSGSESGAGCGFMVAFAPRSIVAGTAATFNTEFDDVTIAVGSTLSFVLSSAGSTPITYSTASGPSNVTLNTSTGAFQFTPTSANTWVITLTAGNSFGTDTQTFRVFASSPGGSGSTSTGTNTAPAVTHPGNKAVAAHDLLSFVVAATDADGDRVTYTLEGGAPTGAFIDRDTGQFVWIPSGEQGPGIYPITVLVGDGVNESRSTFTVTVDDTAWTRDTSLPTNQFRRL